MKKETATWSVVAMLSIIVASLSIASFPHLSGLLAAASVIVCIGAMAAFVASINFAFDERKAAEAAEEESSRIAEQMQGSLVFDH